MINTFKAAVMFEQNAPLQILDLPHCAAEFGQVKVKMIRSGICGAQRNEMLGVKGVDKFLPHLMGHEGFGQVVSIGDGVQKCTVGDYVVLHWKKGSGCDCFGGKYKWKNYICGSGPVTTFSEYTIVSENRLTAVNFEKDLIDIYPLLGCALSTTYGIVKNEIRFNNKDKNILITGAGGIGLGLAFWLKILGFTNVTLYDKSLSKRNKVLALNYKYFSDNDKIELFDGIPRYDFCIDTTGNNDLISKSFDLLNKMSSLILLGQTKKGSDLILHDSLRIFDGIKIWASDGGGFDPDTDIEEMIDILKIHVAEASKLITDKLPLTEINFAFEKLEIGDEGRILISF